MGSKKAFRYLQQTSSKKIIKMNGRDRQTRK